MKKLKKRDALHMIRLNKNTLVLRSKVFVRSRDWPRMKADIVRQVKNNPGVIIVPNYFDVMFVPDRTTVKIEECVR